MFSVKSTECLGFDSKWKVKRVYNEGCSQTLKSASNENSTDSMETIAVQTQTNLEDVDASFIDVDMHRLAAWLSKIYPRINKELTESINSKAFSGRYAYEDGDLPIAKLEQTIKVCNFNEDGTDVIRVKSLSWNSTSSTLAVACNRLHRTWCHHLGQIAFYTFDKNDRLSKKPNKLFKTSSCVSVVRFHPKLPFIIACGTFTGDIIVWNIQHHEADGIVTRIDGHTENLTDMKWIYDVDVTRSLLLVTSGHDGILNLWNFSLPSSLLNIKLRCTIKSPVLARKRGSVLSKEADRKVVRSVLTFDFSLYTPDQFIAGVEGGLIVHCSTLSTNTLKGSTKEVSIVDPVIKYYEPHEGEVISVRFSMNRNDMFISCGTDRELRIYLINQEMPARVIFPEKQLYSVAWVPYHETLLVGCGEKGMPEIFDVMSGQALPNVSSERIELGTSIQLEVNGRRTTTLAIGNEKGELQLWSIPWGLFALQRKNK